MSISMEKQDSDYADCDNCWKPKDKKVETIEFADDFNIICLCKKCLEEAIALFNKE